MTEYFKKVIIVGVNDLPVGDGEFICHQRRLDGVILISGDHLRKNWKTAFDWYLLPVSKNHVISTQDNE